MELLDLDVNPVKANFRGMDIVFNADAFTPDFFRNAAVKFRKLFKAAHAKAEAATKRQKNMTDAVERIAQTFEDNADGLEIDRDFFASILAGTEKIPVLMEWDLTDKGEPVPCTEVELRKRKPKLLKELYTFIVEASNPKSPEIQTTPTSKTISGNSDAGTPTQATQTGVNQIM